MNTNLENIAKANKPTLSHTERASMREEFMAHMDTHPPKAPVPSPYMRFFPAYAFALLLLIIVPTAYATERSLPSDRLYSLKVQILEPLVVSAASISKATEADVRVVLVERRLKEARLLASDGRLGARESSSLSEQLSVQINEVQEYIGESQEEGDFSESLDTGSDLEATLGGYERVLDTLAGAEEITEAIGLERKETAAAGEETEDAITTTPSSETEEYLEDVSEEAERVVIKARNAATATAGLDSQEVLELVEDAEDALDAAQSSEASGVGTSALVEYRDALRAASESLILLEGDE